MTLNTGPEFSHHFGSSNWSDRLKCVIKCPVFIILKIKPPDMFEPFKTGLVWYSDPYCFGPPGKTLKSH